jgi:hypothetical protein
VGHNEPFYNAEELEAALDTATTGSWQAE